MPERIGPILDCALLRWSPRIGDPSVVGWTTVALYFGTAALAAKVVGRSRVFPAETRRRERLFWMAMCALLLSFSNTSLRGGGVLIPGAEPTGVVAVRASTIVGGTRVFDGGVIGQGLISSNPTFVL